METRVAVLAILADSFDSAEQINALLHDFGPYIVGRMAKSLKQTDEAKKKKLLNEAIAPLDKCLAEFPETTQREKVESNRKFIEKELAK